MSKAGSQQQCEGAYQWPMDARKRKGPSPICTATLAGSPMASYSERGRGCHAVSPTSLPTTNRVKQYSQPHRQPNSQQYSPRYS